MTKIGGKFMNWINMTDQDKLISYAKTSCLSNHRIFKNDNPVDSYFHVIEKEHVDCCNIEEYNMGNYGELKTRLSNMWREVGFNDSDLLSTIVSAIIMKNVPSEISVSLLEENTEMGAVVKADYERVSKKDDAPPVYVYEF
jgi:hypothetical protein